MKKIFSLFKNKYVVAALAFVVWLAFFDRNSFYAQYTYKKRLYELESEKQRLGEEIKKNQEIMSKLSNARNLEKFAREKYFMKKDNEEIFVIVKE